MAIRIRGRFMATPLGGHRVDHHRPLTELGASGKCRRLSCLAWRVGGWIVLGGGEGGPAPEAWVFGSCVHVGLGDWRHSCLGFCPGTAAAWTVTGITSPFWASVSLWYSVQIAGWCDFLRGSHPLHGPQGQDRLGLRLPMTWLDHRHILPLLMPPFSRLSWGS